MKHKSPKTLLAEIAEDALIYDLLFDYNRHSKRGKPGEWIQRLPKEKREILEKLTSKDIEDAMLRTQHYKDEKPTRSRRR